jgi:hypothetical protein
MCEWIRKSFTPEVFWVMATALFTLVLVFVAWRQLRDLAKTSRTDLLYRLRKDFFTSNARTLTLFLDYELLNFVSSPMAFFDVKQDVLKTEIQAVATQWVDDYLGILEDIAGLWKAKHITLDEVYESFGYYIELVMEDKAIKDYIEWARKREGERGKDIYENLYAVYMALKKKK